MHIESTGFLNTFSGITAIALISELGTYIFLQFFFFLFVTLIFFPVLKNTDIS